MLPVVELTATPAAHLQISSISCSVNFILERNGMYSHLSWKIPTHCTTWRRTQQIIHFTMNSIGLTSRKLLEGLSCHSHNQMPNFRSGRMMAQLFAWDITAFQLTLNRLNALLPCIIPSYSAREFLIQILGQIIIILGARLLLIILVHSNS